MGPPPRTSAQLVNTMHSTVLPVAIVLHTTMACVFFSHLAIDDASDGGRAAFTLKLSPPPPPHPPPPPPPPNAPGISIGAREFTDGQMLSIVSAIVVTVVTACLVSVWAVWGKLRRPKYAIRARLPKLARSKLDALKAGIFANGLAGGGEAVSEVDTYTPPLTAALLSMHSATAATRRRAARVSEAVRRASADATSPEAVRLSGQASPEAAAPVAAPVTAPAPASGSCASGLTQLFTTNSPAPAESSTRSACSAMSDKLWGSSMAA